MSSGEYGNQTGYNEPSNYDVILRNMIGRHFFEALIGFSFALYGIFIFENTIQVIQIVLLCLFLVALGIYLMIDGLKKMLDRRPKIKLAKQGIWSEKYGFRSWNSIQKTKAVYLGKTVLTLKIYLVGNETNNPDEEIALTGIVGLRRIQHLIYKYHNQS